MNPKRRLLALLLLLAPLTARAAISGAVLDSDGRPIAGARVSLFSYESELAARTRLLSANPEQVPLESVQADAKGNFSLPSPKEAAVFLEISARGHLPHRRAVERDEDLGAILLPKAETKTAVVTAGNKPVAGAVVSVRYGSFELVARTDARGRAEVPDIKRASSITVVHPEHAVDHENFVLSGRTSTSELQRVLSVGTARNGTVVDIDGKTPVGGATVFADGWPLTTTAEDGTFTIPRLPSRWTMIVAQKGTNFAQRAWQASGALSLRMEKGATISGRVTDSRTRLPVAWAQVSVSRRTEGAFFPVGSVTDAKGSYAVAVPAASLGLLVSHPAYASRSIEVAATGGERVARDLVLQPLTRFSGMVVDEGGEGVAIATVGPESETWVMGSGPHRDVRITGPDGRFVLRTAVEREVRLRATKKGHPDGKTDPIRVNPGEHKTGIVITIPSGLEVTGRVTDEDDNPLGGVAIVTVEAQPGGRARPFVMGGPASDDDAAPRTGPDGSYSIRVKEGSWDFAFRREGYATEYVRAQKIAAGEPNEVNAAMEPAVEISGRVVRGGAGIEGVRLFAFNAGDPISTTTEANGSFVLGGLAEGETGISLRKPEEFIQETKTLTAPARDVVIEIPAGQTVSGRVVEKGSKRAVTSFQAGISVSRSGGGMIMMAPPLLRNFTSEDGSFVLENVPLGAVNVVATAPGFTTGKVNLSIEAEKEIRDVEIELDRGVRLFGRVTSSSGTPLSDAFVRLLPAPGRPPASGPEMQATSDANGDYSIDALEPGEQTIEVLHELGSARKTTTLKGPSTRLDLQLDPGVQVTGLVVDGGGSPVAEAEVSASAGGRWSMATSRADGTFELQGLPAGRYTFRAAKAGFAPARLEDVDISGGAPLRLTLGSGGSIYGRVTGIDERDYPQTNVQAFAGPTNLSSPVDSSGNFRIEGVTAGTWQVQAWIASRGFGRQKTSTARTVTIGAGGSQQVDLEFRDDVVVSGRVTRNGAPLAGAIVSFAPKVGAGTYTSSNTDDRGLYELTGLAEGEYHVSVADRQRFSSYRTTFTVRGSDTFDIEYGAVTVRGRVADAGNGEPIGSATVELRNSAFNETPRADFSAATDAAGAFAFDLVPPGSYVLSVSREGFGNQVRSVTVGTTPIDDLDVKLARSDDVAFRIVDGRDGRVLRGAATVIDAQGRVIYDSRSSGPWSTPDELRLALSPGAYTAAIFSQGFAPRMISFTAPSRQTVALTPGGTIQVASKHPAHRRIVLVDASGQRYLYNPWQLGRIGLLPNPGVTTIPNVAPGHYTIQLLSDDETTVVSSVQVVVPEGGTVKAEL